MRFPVKKRQDTVQISIDNALKSARMVLESLDRHLQAYRDFLSVTEESVWHTQQPIPTPLESISLTINLYSKRRFIIIELYAAATATTFEPKADPT
ncbi:hypothetical protein CPC08DRAFT_764881 [Agrocybe pediades]|nr:hypothetical protein CPC08DRAFT_764881 [Agrocybe pediades]